jgi:parvulin-like peptidyl-prolyl isomerase
MLHKMRENTKVVLWIVVVAFVVTIFAVWGLDLQTGRTTGDPSVIGTINGVSVTRSQYQFVYEQFAQQLRAASQDQGGLTYTQQEFAHSQAWDNIVYGILTNQEIDKLGITVTDEEVVAFLRNSPPVEVRQYFLDEQGNFDDARYQAELNNPANDWTSLEALARERIPRVKLNEYLAAQVHVSEEEQRRAYEMESVDLAVRYVEFPFDAADLGDYEPTEEDITRYYEGHQDDFLDPVKARVELVKIELSPSVEDKEDALYTANRIRDQIVDGEEFGELARSVSEAPTSFVEGSTGFITRDRRDAVYFDALDAMQPGDLSAVIETPEGYYILKLDEKRAGDTGDMEYSAEEILITAMLSRSTVDSLYEKANGLRDRAIATDLATAATEMGLTLLTPTPFAERGIIESIGFSTTISKFAFSEEPGTISNVLRDNDNLYVVRINEMLPEAHRSIDEAREQLHALVIEDRKRSAAKIQARAFYQKSRTSDWDTSVQTYSVDVVESGLFRGTDELGNLGAASAVASAALSVEPGQIVPPVEWRRHFVVFELQSRSTIDTDDYRAKITTIRDRLRSQKAQLFVQEWFENLKESSEIEDYRLQS